jgi:uncharacterized protein YllA (UPF0747 family)
LKLQSISFSKLGFRSLFTDYLEQKSHITRFYEIHPFRDSAAVTRASKITHTCNRNALAEALRELHQPVTSNPTVYRQIDKLKDPETMVVVTGQQLTLFGGPLFTLYKIATAILYSRRYQEELGREVIPVFWLADEDHDVEEVRSVWVHDASGALKPISFPDFVEGRPVSEQYPSEESFRQVFEQLRLVLPDTDFRASLAVRLQKAWTHPHSFRDAFATWIMDLFADEGLILCGSHSEAIKELSRPVFETYVADPYSFFDRVDRQTKLLLESGYHQQVVPMESNLFLLDEDMQRRKLQVRRRGDGEASGLTQGNIQGNVQGSQHFQWSLGEGDEMEYIELQKIVKEELYRLSPNVFLRPIVQDELLPVLAYVAGPSELSYYAQLRDVYPLFGKTMPIILPRFSLTLVEPHISRAAGNLPFELHEYRLRTEDLETEYIRREHDHNLEAFFQEWTEAIQKETEARIGFIEEVDPTLVKAASRAESVFHNELMKLKGKLIRAVKQKQENQIGRIHKVQSFLFPHGGLQEREVALIHPLNKYGPEFIPGLMHLLENETPESHKFLFL